MSAFESGAKGFQSSVAGNSSDFVQIFYFALLFLALHNELTTIPTNSLSLLLQQYLLLSSIAAIAEKMTFYSSVIDIRFLQ